MSTNRPACLTTTEGILPRLVRKYLELADICYRVAVTTHD